MFLLPVAISSIQMVVNRKVDSKRPLGAIWIVFLPFFLFYSVTQDNRASQFLPQRITEGECCQHPWVVAMWSLDSGQGLDAVVYLKFRCSIVFSSIVLRFYRLLDEICFHHHAEKIKIPIYFTRLRMRLNLKKFLVYVGMELVQKYNLRGTQQTSQFKKTEVFGTRQK